jgi:hypothetical protein
MGVDRKPPRAVRASRCPSTRRHRNQGPLREALDELAERHGIRASDIAYAMEGYADDLLSDAIYNVERELEQEIEAEDPV